MKCESDINTIRITKIEYYVKYVYQSPVPLVCNKCYFCHPDTSPFQFWRYLNRRSLDAYSHRQIPHISVHNRYCLYCLDIFQSQSWTLLDCNCNGFYKFHPMLDIFRLLRLKGMKITNPTSIQVLPKCQLTNQFIE